jgi:hypothetical protein
MKTIAGVLIVAAVVLGSGCARSDWIERTLVTADVTGTWSGSTGGGGDRMWAALSGSNWSNRDQGSKGGCNTRASEPLDYHLSRGLSTVP